MTLAIRLGIHSQAGYGFYVKLTPMRITALTQNYFLYLGIVSKQKTLTGDYI
jgi:hypothetical protein